jgi:hypothetical protein
MATPAAMTVETIDLDLSAVLLAIGVVAVPAVIASVLLLIFNRPKSPRD